MADHITGSILLADDDPGFREMTRLLLVQHNYECDMASTGSEVQSRLRDKTYDLLISDIDMPGNQDLGLIAALPQIQAGLPVILVTGAPSVESAAQSVSLAVAAYLIKPVRTEALLAQVDEAIRRYRCFQAVTDSRERLVRASADLELIAASLRKPAGGSADPSARAFLDLTIDHAARSLGDVRRVVDALGRSNAAAGGEDPLRSARPVALMQALWETVAVLERTKSSFKSKELGQLRSRIERLLQGHEQSGC